MQQPQLYRDKLEIISWITQLENQDVIQEIKAMIPNREAFKLTEDQQRMLEETAVKYYSVDEPYYTWEEVKAMARKKLNEKSE